MIVLWPLNFVTLYAQNQLLLSKTSCSLNGGAIYHPYHGITQIPLKPCTLLHSMDQVLKVHMMRNLRFLCNRSSWYPSLSTYAWYRRFVDCYLGCHELTVQLSWLAGTMPHAHARTTLWIVAPPTLMYISTIGGGLSIYELTNHSAKQPGFLDNADLPSVKKSGDYQRNLEFKLLWTTQ